MSENHDNRNEYSEQKMHTVILPTAPGANPSSFPDFKVGLEMQVPDPRREHRGDYIDLPDGSHIAPNGAVIEEPMSGVPEVAPPNEYTPDKEDLDLMIM